MPRVLISYRRSDSAAYAGRLFDRLSERFGRDSVFLDIDAITPGQDFITAIGERIASCDCVLVVIGRRWLTEKDGAGRRRLDDPADLVRIEVATALNRSIYVIPVLVGGATMPHADEVPNDLSKLQRLQALEISDARFHHDVDVLLAAIAGDSVGSRPVRNTGENSRPRWALPWPWAVAGIGFALVLFVGWGQWSRLQTAGTSRSATQDAGSPTAATPGSGLPAVSQPARQGGQAPSAGRVIVESITNVPRIAPGAPPPVKELPTLGTIDKPERIELGVTYRIKLRPKEPVYMTIAQAVSELRAIVDFQIDKPTQNAILQGGLSVLDRDGVVVKNDFIAFNESGLRARRMGTVSFAKPTRIRLQISPSQWVGLPDTCFLTVFDGSPNPFVPLFGHITPLSMRLDENQTGALDFGDEHYYGISLKKGTYKTILDFTNKPRQVGIARGSLSLLDVMGSESREVLSFNEEGVTIRKIGTFTVDSEGPAIILVSTGWGSVTYNLRIVPADNGS